MWLQEYVEEQVVLNEVEVDADVISLSKPPSEYATKYRSMWSFGNHLRVAGVEHHLRTCDSGVAATFRQPWRSGTRNRHLILADVEYVGQLQEIVELNYGGLCVIVCYAAG